MLKGNPIAFCLPVEAPAFSVAKVDSDHFVATDGRERVLYLFSSQGKFTEGIPTPRVYETVTPMGDKGYLALARCNCRRFANRAYVLNRDFEEIGCMDLSAEDPCEALIDIYCETDGTILAAYENSLRRVSPCDNRQEFMRNNICVPIFHVASGNEFIAVHHRSRRGDLLTVRTAEKTISGSVSGRLVLRDLIPLENGMLYGLFGFRYRYNYLLQVYVDGKITLPAEEDLLCFLQNITPRS